MAVNDANLLALWTAIRNGAQAPALLGYPGITLCHDYTRNLDYVRGASATSALTVTRASDGTYKNNDGSISTFTSNNARIGNRGLLSEETRTNSFAYSADFSHATWAKTTLTVTADQVAAPDGTTTADKLEASGTSAPRVTQSAALTSGTANAVSFFVKAGNVDFIHGVIERAADSQTLRFYANLSTGVGSVSVAAGTIAGTISLEQYTGGWWRVIVIVTTATTGSYTLAIGPASSYQSTTVTSGSYVYAWGAQVETGGFVTSYIATTTAAAVRAEDTIITTSFAWYTPTAGTLYAYGNTEASFAAGQNNGLFGVDNGNTTERIQLRKSSSGTTEIVVDGGVTQALASVASGNSPATVRIAAAYAANNFIQATNGVLSSRDTAGTLPTPTTGRIGFAFGVNHLNGYLREIAAFNRVLSDSELQAITAGVV